MNIRLLAYSAVGCATAERIAAALRAQGDACRVFAPADYCGAEAEPLTVRCAEWAKAGFMEADALVFCCAAGIAVRGIAPWVRSKKEDPAVVIVDETGRFSIPILSGHIGGANELALRIAAAIGATPVVTTATDLHALFAVDVFATKNHLRIESLQLAKEVSAALLKGEAVGFQSDLPVGGDLPKELTAGEAPIGVCVTADPEKAPWDKTLRLVPMRYAVGMGCRKDKPAEDIERFFLRQLEACGVRPAEVRCLASIDVKKDEKGLLALSKKYAIPFETWSAEALLAVPGAFSGSSFVQSTVGVDCVCERAALCAGARRLIRKKTSEEGMTFALAAYEEEIRFA